MHFLQQCYWGDLMKVFFDKQLYSDITKLSLYDAKENIMLIGAKRNGDSLETDPKTFKWFCPEELKAQTEDNAIVSEKTMVKNVSNIISKGYNSVIMIHTHPCKTDIEDWLFASLSEEDLNAAKNVELICELQGARFFAGVSTCNGVYFWMLDPKSYKPIQLDCYIDGVNVTKKVPTTLQEIVVKLQNTK